MSTPEQLAEQVAKLQAQVKEQESQMLTTKANASSEQARLNSELAKANQATALQREQSMRDAREHKAALEAQAANWAAQQQAGLQSAQAGVQAQAAAVQQAQSNVQAQANAVQQAQTQVQTDAAALQQAHVQAQAQAANVQTQAANVQAAAGGPPGGLPADQARAHLTSMFQQFLGHAFPADGAAAAAAPQIPQSAPTAAPSIPAPSATPTVPAPSAASSGMWPPGSTPAQPTHVSRKEATVEYFDGTNPQDAQQWVDKFDDVATLNNWMNYPVELEMQFRIKLKKSARVWYDQDIRNLEVKTWDIVKEKFLKRFKPDMMRMTLQIANRRQKKDEDVRTFATDLQRMMAEVPSHDHVRINQFINLLKPEYRERVQNQMPETMSAAVNSAIYYESVDEQKRQRAQEAKMLASDEMPKEMFGKEDKSKSDKHTKGRQDKPTFQLPQWQAPPARSAFQQPPRASSGMQTGGIRNFNRPAVPWQQQNSMSQARPMDVNLADNRSSGCWNCGQPGHMAAQCPQPKQHRQAMMADRTDHIASTRPAGRAGFNVQEARVQRPQGKTQRAAPAAVTAPALAAQHITGASVNNLLGEASLVIPMRSAMKVTELNRMVISMAQEQAPSVGAARQAEKLHEKPETVAVQPKPSYKTMRMKAHITAMGDRSNDTILDTGASFSLVSKSFLTRHGLQDKAKKTSSTYATADGRVATAAHVVPRAQVVIAGYVYTLDLWVAANPSFDLLLGIDFMDAAGAIVFVKKRKVQIYMASASNAMDCQDVPIDIGVPGETMQAQFAEWIVNEAMPSQVEDTQGVPVQGADALIGAQSHAPELGMGAGVSPITWVIDKFGYFTEEALETDDDSDNDNEEDSPSVEDSNVEAAFSATINERPWPKYGEEVTTESLCWLEDNPPCWSKGGSTNGTRAAAWTPPARTAAQVQDLTSAAGKTSKRPSDSLCGRLEEQSHASATTWKRLNDEYIAEAHAIIEKRAEEQSSEGAQEADKSDWMIHPSIFSKFNMLCGPHDIDAACDKQGRNALVHQYWTAKDDFRRQDWAHHTTWANVPFNMVHEAVTQFLRGKYASPDDTAATFVVPAWQNASDLPKPRLCVQRAVIIRLSQPVQQVFDAWHRVRVSFGDFIYCSLVNAHPHFSLFLLVHNHHWRRPCGF